MGRKKADDRPMERLTVAVMDDQGRPRVQLKVSDRISADVLANGYQAKGSVVVIAPTRD